MKRQQGFTLIELLVVVAIIGILAGIIVPNVITYLSRARMTRASAEINGIDTALTKMLTDAGRQDFRSFFDAPDDSIIRRRLYDGGNPANGLINPADPDTSATNLAAAQNIYTTAFYLLLKLGKNADSHLDWADLADAGITINAEVKRKLGTEYMSDLGKDPFGNLYQFFPGPLRASVTEAIPFRIREVTSDVPGGPTADGNTITYTDENGDDLVLGYPAPRNQPMYVYSFGANLVPNQFGSTGYDGNLEMGDDFVGGGDDINNWDTENSWAPFY